jgi:nucleotide-binding universal stress UspA family protein
MRIMLAVDNDRCSQAAVEALIAGFRSPTTEVLVLHVVDRFKSLPPHMSFARGPSVPVDFAALDETLLRHANTLVERVANRLRAEGFTTAVSVKEGRAQDVIVEEAAAWHAHLIVMGTHGRNLFDLVVVGSVAQGVLPHAKCLVEVVRAAAPAAKDQVPAT